MEIKNNNMISIIIIKEESMEIRINCYNYKKHILKN